MFKKAIVLLLTLMMCVAFSGCEAGNEKDFQDQSTTSSDISSTTTTTEDDFDNVMTTQNSQMVTTTQVQKVTTHVALQGAVIVEQDGTGMFRYKKKCEACGYIPSGTISATHYDGKNSSSFTCSKCGNQQKIEIEHHTEW